MKNACRVATGVTSFIFFCTIFLLPVEAHLPGQQPYFKINGTYSTLYPVLVSSVPDFTLPQDSAPDSYMVNTPIEFDLDVSMLPFPPEIATNSSYIWDFGDKTTGEGIKNSHTYTAIGSYIVSIDIQDPTGAKQLLQSVLINIVPDKQYELPKASIRVNGQGIKDPLVDTVNIKQGQEVKLSAEGSHVANEVVEYYWDLGDRESANGPIALHHYNIEEWMFFPVLRIKDKNGFIADTFVQINNGIEDTTEKKGLIESTRGRYTLIGSGIIAGIIVLGLFILLRKRK